MREALDDLPDLLIKALDRVPVVISNKGRQVGAYGLYQGDTVARDNYHDRIIIFRDTLLRDFGHDPDLLRDQVTRTVRHELAHHLGADELGVREMGLVGRREPRRPPARPTAGQVRADQREHRQQRAGSSTAPAGSPGRSRSRRSRPARG